MILVDILIRGQKQRKTKMMKIQIDHELVNFLREEEGKEEEKQHEIKYAFLVGDKVMLLPWSPNTETLQVKSGARHHYGYVFPGKHIQNLFSSVD